MLEREWMWRRGGGPKVQSKVRVGYFCLTVGLKWFHGTGKGKANVNRRERMT